MVAKGLDGTTASAYVGAIDLGSPGSPGGNTMVNNCGANLWIDFVPSSSLRAEGNTFGAGNCATGSWSLSDGVPLCVLGLSPQFTNYDVGIPATSDGGLARGAVDVASCSPQ